MLSSPKNVSENYTLIGMILLCLLQNVIYFCNLTPFLAPGLFPFVGC